MLVWIIYDISSDRDRTKIVKFCRECGLIRVQYSVFFGNIPKNAVDTIAEKSKDLIDVKTDGVFIIPISEDDFEKKIMIGKNFDEDFATGKQQTLIL